jgi:predicted phosphodiesterase
MGVVEMRIGLVADIHGNDVALQTVLRELNGGGIDLLLCLGDVCVLGPQPRECIERLRELGCAMVLGNTDDWLLNASARDEIAGNPVMRDLADWCAEQLTAADIESVRGFLPSLDVTGDGWRISCFHGSPQDYNDVINTLTTDEDFDAMLASHDATVWAGGHTHVQLLRRHRHGHIVNPGSVGLPGVGPGVTGLLVNRDVTWAEYAIITLDGKRVSIDLRRTPLDMDAMLQSARNSGMPHLDWWTKLYRTS